jgi:peptidoglycan/xylan/chitin deacetylase (PgdA/CDA1 family)
MPRAALEWCVRKGLLGANLAAPPALFATGFQNPWIIGAATLAHAAFASAIVRPGCGWFGPVVTRFRPNGNDVWLTIDDGPAGAATDELSMELSRRNVRATFFVKGRNLAAQPAIARRLMDAGHTLANHTDTHPSASFWRLRPSRLRAEIDACNTVLRNAGVPETRWFRAPVGLKHTRLHPILTQRGMRLIAWSIRSGDGISCDPQAVARRVASRAKPGSIILLHERRPRSNEAILRVVDELQRQKYGFTIPADGVLMW